MLLDEQAKGLVEHTIELDYDYWTTGKHRRFFHEKVLRCSVVEECLHVFLPQELREGAPTGFSMIGHIGMPSHLVLIPELTVSTAHINLNDEYLPYKHIIGQLIMDVGDFDCSLRIVITLPDRKTRA